jgi:uncharacterized membrane protein
MSLRSPRERALQTILYEACGFLIATPFYMLATGTGAAEGAGLVIGMSVAVMLWTPLHNTAWDWAEWRLARRAASDRPQLLRVVHALSAEASSVLVTLPILMRWGGLTLHQAVALEAGLILLYAAYAWVFHRVYDWWRPVRPVAMEC